MAYARGAVGKHFQTVGEQHWLSISAGPRLPLQAGYLGRSFASRPLFLLSLGMARLMWLRLAVHRLRFKVEVIPAKAQSVDGRHPTAVQSDVNAAAGHSRTRN